MINEFFELNEEAQVVRLTQDGVVAALTAYELQNQGWEIESIEQYLGLEAVSGNEEHLEYRILLSLGELSGLFENYESFKLTVDEIDQIERDMEL